MPGPFVLHGIIKEAFAICCTERNFICDRNALFLDCEPPGSFSS